MALGVRAKSSQFSVDLPPPRLESGCSSSEFPRDRGSYNELERDDVGINFEACSW